MVIPSCQDRNAAGKVLKLGRLGKILIRRVERSKLWIVRFIGGINVVATKDKDVGLSLGNDLQNSQRFFAVQAATEGDGLQWGRGCGQALNILRCIRVAETQYAR